MTRMNHSQAIPHLKHETLGLLERLKQAEPFSVSMPMVAAAGVSKPALAAVTRHWADRRKLLITQLQQFLALLNSSQSTTMTDSALQSRFARLKLRFNSLLDQFDIFADVVSQRAEYKTGVWIAGLDILAADALQLDPGLYRAPPLMCYVERGHGAAIRKARTRLPGGDSNPVAIIQVPRERLVGSGVAASIIHETGHQGAALLDLLPSIRQAMRKVAIPAENQRGWQMLDRWLSEIIADFWSMGHLGVSATSGLMSVVGLPAYFMFRAKDDDPHPFPWIRVVISMAFGERLYPDPQWHRLWQLWHSLYPMQGREAASIDIIRQVSACLPVFVELVIGHRNAKTQGKPLADWFPVRQRQPAVLRQLFDRLKDSDQMPPSLVFAVTGQARTDGRLSPEAETRLLSDMLTRWARKRAETSL